MPTYYTKAKRADGSEYVAHQYVDEVLNRPGGMPSVIFDKLRRPLDENGGSDPNETTLLTPQGEEYDPDDLRELVNNSYDDVKKATYTINGVTYRVFSKVGSDIPGLVFYEDSNEVAKKVEILGNNTARFLLHNGQKALLSKVLNEHYDRLLKVAQHCSSRTLLLEDNLISYLDRQERIPLGVNVCTPQESLKRIGEMSCVFLSFHLALCTGELWDEIRELMGISNKTHVSKVSSVMVPQKFRMQVLPYSNRKNPDRNRTNGLLAFLQYHVSNRRGERVSHTAELDTNDVSYLTLKCGLEGVIVSKENYERSMDIGLKAPSGNSKFMDHANLFRTMNDGKETIYHLSKQNHLDRLSGCLRNNNKTRKFPLVFLMSNEGDRVRHLDVECNAMDAVSYFRDVVCTTFPITISVGTLDKDGEYVSDTAMGSDVLDGEQIGGDCFVYDRICMDSIRTTAGKPVDKVKEIRTIGELSDMIDDIKNENIQWLERYSSIDISEDAFSMPMNQLDTTVEVEERELNRVMTLKQLYEICQSKESRRKFLVPIKDIEIGTTKQCMDRLNLAESERNSNYFKKALCLREDKEFVPRESVFGNKGVNVVDAGCIQSFVIRLPHLKHKCRVNQSLRKSTLFADKIAAIELGPNRRGFPGVSELIHRGREKSKEIEESLARVLRGGGDNMDYKIELLEEQLRLANDCSTWLGRDIHRQNFPLFNATFDKVENITKGNGKKTVYAKGIDVLKRIRIAPAPDVMKDRSLNSKAYEPNVIPTFTSDQYVHGMDVRDVDIAGQYKFNMMGSGNTAFDLDYKGELPAIAMERNLYRGKITHPIVFSYAQCGIINFDPSKVNRELYGKLHEIHKRAGSSLYQQVGAVNGPKIIQSSMLIQWTMDLWDRRPLAEATQNMDSFLTFARHFQFDILGITTGRFVFRQTMRELLYDLMVKYPTKFPDYGGSFYNTLKEVGNELEEGFSKMFIFPVRHPILNGWKCTTGGECVHDINDIKIDVRGNGINTRNPGMVHRTIYESCLVFQLMARSIVQINNLSDQLDKECRKFAINSCVGKTSMHKKLSIKKSSDVVVSSKDQVVVDIKKFDPSKVVFLTELKDNIVSEIVTVKRELVRNSPEGLRTVVTFLAGRQIEYASFGVYSGSELLRGVTDGFQVKLQDADEVVRRLKKITGHVEGGCKNGLPGYCVGVKDVLLTSQELADDHKYARLLANQHTNGMKTGIVGMTSDWKNYIDNLEVYRKTEKELRVDYHVSLGEPFLNVDTPSGRLVNGYTPDTFLDFVRRKDHPEELMSRIGDFETGFRVFEGEWLNSLHSFAMSGPPGNGKSTSANGLADLVMEEDDAREIAAIVPFHTNKAVFAPHVKYSQTVSSAIGCGKTMKKVRFNPIPDQKNHEFSPLLCRSDPLHLLIQDEVCATSIDAEEAMLMARNKCTTYVIIGDPYQGHPPMGCGICLEGAVVRYLTNNTLYMKDVPYRNQDPEFIRDLDILRKGGDTSLYLEEGLCRYYDDDMANDLLMSTLERMAKQLVVGENDTALVCQSHNTAAICIYTIVRGAVKLKKPLLALTHIGECVRSGVSKDADESADDVDKYIFLYGDRRRGGKPMQDVHEQRYYGMPMVFYKGSSMVVKTSFLPAYHPEPVKGHPIDFQSRLETATNLVYLRHYYQTCSLKPRKNKDEPAGVREMCEKIMLVVFEDAYKVRYILTEFEVASYLMYPFVSQQCNLIGQTKQKVVMVNFVCKSNLGDRDAIAYTSIKDKLAAVQRLYGKYSNITELCGNMQVMCSRTRTGEKILVLDVRMDMIPDYTKMAHAAYTGSMCNGFCARFNETDRGDQEYRRDDGTVQIFNQGVKEILRLRPLRATPMTTVMVYDRNHVLDFPQDRLECKDVDDTLIYYYMCVYPTSMGLEMYNRNKNERQRQEEIDAAYREILEEESRVEVVTDENPVCKKIRVA